MNYTKSIYKRQSNFELLRLVAIFMVLLHHSLLFTNNCGYYSDYSVNINGATGVFINSLCIIGVNLFIMISGYFGVKTPIKNFGRIIIEVVSISIFLYIIGIILNQYQFSFAGFLMSIYRALFKNWFVVAYLMFLLFIPLIEPSIDKLAYSTYKLESKFIIVKREFNKLTVCVFLLAIITIIYGYIIGVLNDNGYNMLNFVFLFVLSRWLKIKNFKIPNWLLVISYLLFSCILLAQFIYIFDILGLESNVNNGMRVWGYNNPLIILSSIVFFLIFKKLSFTSLIINRMANCVFGVYLMHIYPSLLNIWKPMMLQVFSIFFYGGVIIFDIILFLVLLSISYVINILIVRPLIKKYNNLF